MRFKCDLCPQTFSWKFDLKRHYKNKHGLNQNDAEAKVNTLKDPPQKCKYCFGEYVRVGAHEKNCKFNPNCPRPQPMAQNPSKKANTGPGSYQGRVTSTARGTSTQESRLGRTSPTTAMRNLSVTQTMPVARSPGVAGTSGVAGNAGLSRVARSGNVGPSGDVFANNLLSPMQEDESQIPEVLNEFEKFCKSMPGRSLAANSVSAYKTCIRQFLRLMVMEKKDITAPMKILNVYNPHVPHGSYVSLPNPGHFVEVCFPNEKLQTSKRSSAFNAFIKFCDFLTYMLQCNQDDFGSIDDYMRRDLHIKRQRQVAHDMDRDLNRSSAVLNQQRQLEESTLLEMDREVPNEVMEKALQAYKDSQTRKMIYEHLLKKMAVCTTGPIASEENIRDFLMLEVFIEGAGMRPDVVYNLMWEELVNAEMSKDGKFFIVHVAHHKTASTYGTMNIFIPRKLHKILTDFCCEIYPDHFKKNQRQLAKTPEEITEAKTIQLHDRVFVTKGGKALGTFAAAIELWKKCAGPDAFGGYNITPIHFRKYAATKFQEDADPITREQAPRMIGHSQKTATKTYQLQAEVQKRHATMRQKVLPNEPLDLHDLDDDISDPSWQPSSTEQSEFMKDQQQKSKQAALKEREALGANSWMPTSQHKLSPKQQAILRQTFQHLTESRDTLLDEHLKRAMNIPEFAAMIQELQETYGRTLKEVWTVVKNSYRAWQRKRNK